MPDVEAADLRARPRPRALRQPDGEGDRGPAAGQQYRFSALVLEIVNSLPFQSAKRARARHDRSPADICRAARSSGAWAPSIALPVLDAMTPAFAAGGSAMGRFGEAGPLRLAFTYVPNGITMADWTPAAAGTGLRVHAHPEAARAVPRRHAGALRPGAQERQRARRRPGRSRARGRVVPDRRAPAQDRRRRHPERHLGRSDRRAASRPARRASRRSSSGATTRGPSATAIPAIPAPTPTACRGADRRRRCRPRPIRGWCSSGCSATSTRASRRTCARGGCCIAAASSTSSPSARRG